MLDSSKTQKNLSERMDQIAERINTLDMEEEFVQNMIDSNVTGSAYDKTKSLAENHY